jgi:hypothetical protein
MMQAVQPFVDTAISKTVNMPADYPYDDFKNLYLQAWQAGLKGLATYRPNSILGSVLEATPATRPAPVAAAPEASPMVAYDPMRTVIEKRPKGALPAVAEKIEYWTSEGHKTPVPDRLLLAGAGGRRQGHGGAGHRVLHAGGPERRVAAVDHLHHAHALAGGARRLPGPRPVRHAQGQPGTAARCAWAPTKRPTAPTCRVARQRSGGHRLRHREPDRPARPGGPGLAVRHGRTAGRRAPGRAGGRWCRPPSWRARNAPNAARTP